MLAGPARTMRGVPPRVLRQPSGFRRTRRDADGLVVVLAGAAAGYAGTASAGHRGRRARQSPRRRASVRRTRQKAAAPQRRVPRVNHGRLRQVTWPLFPSQLLAPVPAVHGQGPSGPARRRCALEAVKEVVTTNIAFLGPTELGTAASPAQPVVFWPSTVRDNGELSGDLAYDPVRSAANSSSRPRSVLPGW